jgi:hypothetical protein
VRSGIGSEPSNRRGSEASVASGSSARARAASSASTRTSSGETGPRSSTGRMTLIRSEPYGRCGSTTAMGSFVFPSRDLTPPASSGPGSSARSVHQDRGAIPLREYLVDLGFQIATQYDPSRADVFDVEAAAQLRRDELPSADTMPRASIQTAASRLRSDSRLRPFGEVRPLHVRGSRGGGRGRQLVEVVARRVRHGGGGGHACAVTVPSTPQTNGRLKALGGA